MAGANPVPVRKGMRKSLFGLEFPPVVAAGVSHGGVPKWDTARQN